MTFDDIIVISRISSELVNDCSVRCKQFIRNGRLLISIKVLPYVVDSCLNGLTVSDQCLFDDICDIQSSFSVFVGYFE